MADFGVLHRNEASGALTGLTRVRRFVQDDAHIFCRESQVKDEVEGVLKFIDDVYKIFGFEYELELSTRPENYLGDVETWNRAEHQLKEALTASGKPWKVNEGDGAFYGPKIDIGVFDALKRKFQCATLQLDFQLPINFKLTYAPEEQGKLERPVMIHRAILGSFERMVAILLEHYGGKWPLWLSPRQAIVCPTAPKPESGYNKEAILEYAKEVRGKMHKAGFYVDVDMTDETFNKKVALAQAAQYNYILAVGPAEVNSGEVTIRVRDKKDQALSTVSVDDAIRRFREEVAAFQ
jgi:threonyl-tRNA synthetase